MKRYWLFGGSVYYASGGLRDFRGSFDSIPEAQLDAETRPDCEDPSYQWYWEIKPVEWWDIFDSEVGKIVAKSVEEPHGIGDFPDQFVVQQ